MHLIIDGFNLIYKFPHLEEKMYLSNLGDARRGLLEVLNRYLKKQKTHKIDLFLDGRKEKGLETTFEDLGKIRIHYSLDEKADIKIKEFIKKNPSPGNLFVVSSDKDIIFYCKRYGCKFFSSEEFSSMIQSLFHKEETHVEEENRIHKELNPDELKYWASVFRERKG